MSSDKFWNLRATGTAEISAERAKPMRISRRLALKMLGATAASALLPASFDIAFADLIPLDPVGLDGSPAQAFASHKARANGIARHFALTRHLKDINGQADENHTTTLLAHFHTIANDPGFTPPGQDPSASAAPLALRRLNKGNGLVGTTGASTHRDYDMALKGLMVLAYRYPGLLGTGADGKDGVDFILDELVPANISGGHPPEIEIVEQSFLNIDTPETENHLLMIESSRYLINQLRFDRGGNRKFDNTRNGLRRWLLGFMQTIAKHDFLEFNSRPYARLALHALFNLHEFARDEDIRTAAQMLLDYSMMKFAVSSNRSRRVSPFRRQQHRINHQANERNYLFSEGGDQVAGFFTAYTGMTDPSGNPAAFPASLTFAGLIAGTAAYRPPPAAYILALKRDNPASLHRFFHGQRPRLASSPDDAESGLEIYYHSPSFLLSAGGQFLNSGYGHDEIDIGKEAWEQTSRAQATTLIPTRADTGFHDLIRLEPYPDPQINPYADDPEDPDTLRARSVNIGVHRGIIAGANLRPAEKKTVLENSTSTSQALTLHNGVLFIAWKGSGNDNLNVARVQGTTLLGIDGVEGIEQKTILGETSDRAPALASHNGKLFIAWKGSGNNQLNIAFSEDDGHSFKGKVTLGDSSELAPALISHNGRLYLSWTGRGNEKLNVAKVVLFGNTAGGFGIEGLEGKVVLGDSSEAAPSLASHNGRLFLAWKGSSNDNLNLIYSEDGGASFRGKATFGDTSSHGPSIVSHAGRLFMAWKGSGNENLNVAKVELIGNTAGAFGIGALEAKVVLGEISTEPPALGSWNGLLFLAWKGEGEDLLNLRVSRDGSFQAPGPWFFCDLSPLGFYVAAYRAPPTRPDDLDTPLDNLAIVYAVEKSDMDARGIDFDKFRLLTRRRNIDLPATFDYGGFYKFRTIDDRTFSIWFQLTGEKYQPRIVDLAEPVDFTALPLVSGPYLNAPGGHDGHIEIRHPGCEPSPIVLDYRDSHHPVRTDNRSGCAEPWIERTLALFAIGEKFDQSGRPKDAQAALADAVHLYDEVLRLNTDQNGPRLAPPVIKALANMGVDFSVPQNELLQWLANPLFTPYPAISEALLLLGRKLKAPVFLDVIVFNYEQASGRASPRFASDVRERVLKKAILKGWNVRYGTRVTNFEEILVP